MVAPEECPLAFKISSTKFLAQSQTCPVLQCTFTPTEYCTFDPLSFQSTLVIVHTWTLLFHTIKSSRKVHRKCIIECI